ncbi:MAG: hypothetical protein C5B59_00630 [Bacteroidetes bacterium]|nr:MAG: hypothetical protein C5B59_00630 [Bacteroidota bacterium]
MEEKELSPQDSIVLIQSMIDRAKNTVADDSFYFLLWGWLVFAASIIQYVLKVVFQSPYHPMAWLLMFVGVVVSIFHGARQSRKRTVRTYVEEQLDYLWISIFFSYILFGFIFARFGWKNCFSFYMGLYAIGSFVTGRALKFSPLVWGAIGSWLLAIVATFTPFDVNILLCALAIIVSYIIPGYLLKSRYRHMQAHV